MTQAIPKEILQNMTQTQQPLDAAPSNPEHQPAMITGPQIRAGRGLLGWSISRLAELAGVSTSSVWRCERAEEIPPLRAETLGRIQGALERGGCLFLDPSDQRPGGEGVRRRRS